MRVGKTYWILLCAILTVKGLRAAELSLPVPILVAWGCVRSLDPREV